MKEKKAFRIPFITKKQLQSWQALHIISLKPNTKYRGVPQSSFSWWYLLFKNTSTPRLESANGKNSVVYHLCRSRLASRLTLTFFRHLTLINSNFIKQKKIKNGLLFRINFKQFHIFSAYNELQCLFTLHVHFSL